MKTISTACLFIVGLLLPSLLLAAPGNDAVGSATAITAAASCTTIRGDLYNATNENLATSTCGTTNDVWYKLTVPAGAAITTITVNMDNGNTANNGNTYIEVFNASLSTSISTANSYGCSTVGSNYSVALAAGTYYFRVFTTTATNGNSGKYGYSICATYTTTYLANDECTGAVSLTTATNCSNTSGTLVGASASSVSQGCFSTGTYYDVWYSFTATQVAHTVTLSSLGSYIANAQLQVYSGTCSGLVSIACGTTTVTPSNLTAGKTYFIRVAYSSNVPANGGFNICVTTPSLAKVDYSKSYINITKGTTGGTVDPGDILEMRFTMVVSSSTIDSLSVIDTIYNGKGLQFVSGSLALRTNEGKIYGNNSFTDAFDNDLGWTYASGSDLVVRINYGTSASQYARGQLSNTSKPSVFGSTCIIMATYRVLVTAAYNTAINFKTGLMTYRDKTASVMFNINFTPTNLMVYSSPGLCPNATAATNVLSAAEFNGTFGSAPTSGTIPRNRTSTSTLIGTGYGYMPFNTSGGPNDYYYGIANNTSSKFTTTTTWLKPDANGYRVFNHWDISGDHGGSNTGAGAPPCDTTKPYNATTNPCGYMLIVNAAYRADTAFTYTVTGLCPNTYYEISAWFKNICYKCGCDSLGNSSTTAGYIPSDVGDSSGVQPNIAFDVNGVDYYTTGNLKYQGLSTSANAQANSDGLNTWQKRGFVYLTGSGQSSFTLTLRNNAPGGGGNDWALDDIAVKTCLPNMQYSPSTTPTACMNNPITINDTVRSYFNNYNYYKWQKSTDGGTTWSDISGTSGTATPAWNGSAYEFITSYTISNTNTTLANTNDKYRVVVGTTSSNINNSSCSTTDGISIVTLNVVDCNSVLDTRLTSFSAKLASNHGRLAWSTTHEDGQVSFDIEKSLDGTNFKKIGTVAGYANNAATNQYGFTDSALFSGKAHYRIVLITADGKKQYSRTILLNEKTENFMVANLANPFESTIYFDLSVHADSKIEVSLLNGSGAIVKQEVFSVYSGINSLSLKNLGSLSTGVYILQIKNNEGVVTRKLIKQ